MEVFEMIVCVTAIGCFTGVSIVKQIAKGAGSKVMKKIQQLEEENQQLQQRTENMEMLVAGMDTELLESMIELQALENPDKNKERIKETADKQRVKYNTGEGNNGQIEESLRSIASKVLKRVDGYLDEAERKNQHDKNNQRWKGY